MQLKTTVVLEDIRSALNVGSVFRTCDCVGVEGLILGGITASPPHPKLPKTALGATKTVNWQKQPNLIEFLAEKKENGAKILSIEVSESAKNLYETKIPNNSYLVFGNEISGVSNEAMEISHETIYIPMFGQKESLNVANSVAITLYEVLRQNLYTNPLKTV